MGGGIRMDFNPIHHPTFRKIVERPEQMWLIDSVHRRAKALTITQHPNFHPPLGHRFRDSGDQMHLGAHEQRLPGSA